MAQLDEARTALGLVGAGAGGSLEFRILAHQADDGSRRSPRLGEQLLRLRPRRLAYRQLAA